MATVTVNADLSATPDTVTINSGETVTWEGDQDFQIHLPAPHTNPHIGHNGNKWSGTSDPFPGKAAKYKVPYTITRGNMAHDPDIEIQP
jgi:plastocyanin